MCGIAGTHQGTLEQVSAMLAAMPHRGPDASGSVGFAEEHVHLGHLRLSIIDLDPRSNQPMISGDGRYAIVFNGEIYNFLELRRELERDGQQFRTTSDTEVLLWWLIRHGPARIHELDGMFAFCFLDRQRQEMLLARDHIGEKPLFYAQGPGCFGFASEIAALAALPWVDWALDREALRDYLFFLYAPPPRTFYRGVRELLPGATLRYSLATGALTVVPFFDLVASVSEEPLMNTHEDDVAGFHDQFMAAVRSRLVADVPLSLYLSGGLDSNAIAAAIPAGVRMGIVSYTMTYEQDTNAKYIDESVIAVDCARFHGIRNVSVPMRSTANLEQALHTSVAMFGQPFGNPTPLVAAELAREVARSGKVCLAGDGGDELLVGYPRYRAVALAEWLRHLPRAVFSSLARVAAVVPERGRWATRVRRLRQFLEAAGRPAADAYLHWVGYADLEAINDAIGVTGESEFYRRLKVTFNRFSADPVRAAQIVDFISFVPCNLIQAADRSSMAHSIELRSPFLARKLVVAMLATGSSNKWTWFRKKPLLVDAFREEMPPVVRRQPKRPFNPPMSGLIKSNIDWIADYLLDPKVSVIAGHVAPEFLREEIAAFRDGRKDSSTYLWGLCVLECWLRKNAVGSEA